ncbi:carbohydrate-binding module family 21 protein [Macrolepiota fuliginosa MF-IS2]|uniref:Carbohydrate-binding module family 21 protein n=1 Tax=Macrolepiota fuliginosa MF-IS2 TaxID=1400762 RepID=A0A9P5XGC4_9AGAR|nr:carbohydrate-binding module family 21 protein [Macrolepiota fuliginosa MF-IS2]
MPYSVPAPTPAPLPIHSAGRPGHRRSYTQGAFAPLGALPRRRSQPKTVFHLTHDDDSDDSADDSHDNQPLKLNPNNSFRLSISTAPDDNSLVPLRTTGVPFPRSSPLSPPESPQPTTRPNVTRTASTPILLSNGKPLKSSLKSSSSSPHISLPPQQQHNHLRARSAPSTPSIEHPVPKNVHFPTNEEGGLATVRVFNRSAKPASLSRPPGDETETETEGEMSTGSNSGFIRGSSAVFPFPRSPLGAQQDKSPKYEVNPSQSSAVPAQNPTPSANVYLESLSFNSALPGASQKVPPGLSGSLLVRNIAYEKQVAVRFTLDDWQTTSEVVARHLVSLPTLPPAFLAKQQLTYGDIAAQIAPPPGAAPQWDRFSFHIKLEDYAFNLAQRVMYIVIRFNAVTPTGPIESWDNNFGCNYKVAFREAGKTQPQSIPVPNPRGRVFAVSSPPSFAPSTTLMPVPTQPQHAQMIAQTTLARLKKLNLRNYAAPSTSASLPGASTATATAATAVAAPNSSLTVVGNGEAKGMVMEGGHPAHVGGKQRSPSPSESEDEDEECLKTPTGLRFRSPSPPAIVDQDPAVGVQRSGIKPMRSPPLPVPLLSFSSESASSSASSTPPTGGSSPQLDILAPNHRHAIDVRHRPVVLSPLEMGTSPPFSMLADLGPSLTKRREGVQHSPLVVPPATSIVPSVVEEKKEDKPYWPWDDDGKERSEEEVRKVLAGIREKSTSSPVRRVSPTSSGRTSPSKLMSSSSSLAEEGSRSPVMKDGRVSSGPVKEKEFAQLAAMASVVSPQPRKKMTDWSRVGSGWNKVPVGSVAAPSLGHAGSASPGYTPPFSPPPAGAVASPNGASGVGTNHQDSVYQAFVKQWCFAQGPGPSPGQARHAQGETQQVDVRGRGYGHGHGRREGEEERPLVV